MADALDGAVVEFPDGINDGMVVGVEDVFAVLGVASDVDLGDAIGGNGIDVIKGIEIVILRGDVDVVDVEKNAAVGALDDFVEELPFGHFGDVKFGVAGDVFDNDGEFEEIAHFANFLRGEAGGFEGVRHGKKVVCVATVHAAPAEMVGEPGSFGAADEIFEAAEVIAIEFFGGAEVHGDAVLDDFVLSEDLVEDFEGASAVHHEVFGDDFEPVAGWFAGEDVVVMGDTQTDANAVGGEGVEAIGGHEGGSGSLAFRGDGYQ